MGSVTGGLITVIYGVTRQPPPGGRALVELPRVGPALLLVGQLFTPPGALSALLVSIGAVLGGLPLFWTLLVPVAVAAPQAPTR